MTNSWRLSAFALRRSPRFPGAIRRIDRFGDFVKTKLAGVLEDKFAVARFMTIELDTERALDQGLKKGFALDERKAQDSPPVQMQEIESVINEPHLALAVGGGQIGSSCSRYVGSSLLAVKAAPAQETVKSR
jgi:hypothetical protein